MKMKMLSIICGLVVALALVACDSAEQNTAPDEATSTPDVVETPGDAGSFESITTFIAGIGTPMADATVSQAAFTTFPAGIPGINVCGPGLSAGGGCATACGYDPAAYGGTDAGGGVVDIQWTVNNCTGITLNCMGVKYIGPAADCLGQSGVLMNNPDSGGDIRVIDSQTSVVDGGSDTVSVQLAGVDTLNQCHYQFEAVNDQQPNLICTPTCGNGLPDVGEACDDGIALNGTTTCGCQSNCQFATNGTACPDGAFCNGDETCDGVGACQPGTPPSVDDGVGCTDDSCDEVNDLIVNTPNNGNCPGDGAFCNGVEFCDAVTDCTSPGDPCTNPLFPICNEGTDTCDPNPDVCGDGAITGAEDCDTAIDPTCCDPLTCTFEAAGTDPQGDCPDADICDGVAACDGAGACDPTAGGAALSCDNGQFCDGAETCDPVAGCQAGTAPVIDDSVACTDDSCDEVNDIVVNATNDANCDDGVACTDDTCDAVADCVFTPNDGNCNDGVGCTDDTCDAVLDCQFTANDGNCPDNLLFCDGTEFCDAVADCSSTGDPCIAPNVCNEGTDTCDPPVTPDFCNGATLSFLYTDPTQGLIPGCSPKPVAGIGQNPDTCTADGSIAYTAVVNRGAANVGASGFNGDFVDLVRGTITGASPCGLGDTITVGYTGSGRTPVALDTSACDGTTTLDLDFVVPGPFITSGDLEYKTGGAAGSDTVAAIALQVSAETLTCNHAEGDATDYGVASTVQLADDGLIDADCSLGGGVCKNPMFIYCDDAGGECTSPGTLSSFFARGFTGSRLIGVYDTTFIASLGCHGAANQAAPQCGTAPNNLVAPDGRDYDTNIDPAVSQCFDSTDGLTIPANAWSMATTVNGAPTVQGRGLINLSACPLNPQGAAAAGDITTLDFVDLKFGVATCGDNASQTSNDAYAYDQFGVSIHSCEDPDGLIGPLTGTPVGTTSASGVITFIP